jgi:hypothetical protein
MANDLVFSLVSAEHAGICRRYWACSEDGKWLESVDAICKSLSLSTKDLEDYVLAGSVAYTRSILCAACGKPMTVRSRQAYNWLKANPADNFRSCDRVTCQKGDRAFNTKFVAEEMGYRIEIVEAALQDRYNRLEPINYSALDPHCAFCLYCVLIASKSGLDSHELPSIISHEVQIAPTRLLTEKIYLQLCGAGILAPSLRSPISAFNIGSARNSPITYDTERVCWTMAPDSLGAGVPNLLGQLHESLRVLPRKLYEELRTDLIEQECLGEMMNRMRSIGALVDISEEAHVQRAFRKVLSELSIRVANSVVAVVLLDSSLNKLARRGERTGELVSRLLLERLAIMPRLDFVDYRVDTNASRILARSNSLVTKVFSEILVE